MTNVEHNLTFAESFSCGHCIHFNCSLYRHAYGFPRCTIHVLVMNKSICPFSYLALAMPLSRNGKMYSSMPTRRKQGYVPMETPSRSSPIYADLKTLPEMKEQWVDFGPSGSDKEESTEYGLILSDKTNHVNLTPTSPQTK